ncbi:MAG: glycosyltransferase family 1 protein [Opitutales bacterium]
MLRIGVSLEFIKHGKVGGAEQSAISLVNGLNDCLKEGEKIIVFASERINGLSDSIQWIQTKQRSRFINETLNPIVYRKDIDVFLYTNYFTPLFSLRRSKIITIIRDLKYLTFPEHSPLVKRLWLRLCHAITLRKANRIVVISDFVKSDLLNRYGAKWDEKIEVIHNPINWNFFDGRKNDIVHRRDYPYVLSVSAQWSHKNLDTLVKSFKAVKDVYKDYKLLLVGQLSSNLSSRLEGVVDIGKVIEDVGLGNEVMVTGYLSDDEIVSVYKNAKLFVFPSLFEGFGRPPVEALGLGLPVLTNKLSSLLEVTKGFANYVEDVRDENELANNIIAILSDPEKYRPTSEQVSRIRESYDINSVSQKMYELIKLVG